jgi:hypothetical protein
MSMTDIKAYLTALTANGAYSRHRLLPPVKAFNIYVGNYANLYFSAAPGREVDCPGWLG